MDGYIPGIFKEQMEVAEMCLEPLLSVLTFHQPDSAVTADVLADAVMSQALCGKQPLDQMFHQRNVF